MIQLGVTVTEPAVETIGVRKGYWTGEEDDLLKQCIEKYGEGNWRLVPRRAAGRLPGRTANDVKNYWNTYLHKKSSTQRKVTGNQGVPERATTAIVEIVKPRPLTFKKTSSWLVGTKQKPVEEPTWAAGPAEESEAWWKSLLVDQEDSTWFNSNSWPWYGAEPTGDNDPWPILDGHNDLDNFSADVDLWDIVGP
ncbi:hypothetical protein Ancab_032518 [Ancistrocladus abbreviatus]